MRLNGNQNVVRQNFSLKRQLASLNRDLEKVIFAIDEKVLDRIYFGHSHRITSDVLSEVQKAILMLEDRGFFAHRGFEFRAPLRILKRIISWKRLGAISTIDQQLVRIATGRYERTIRRKVREALLAFLLNAHRSKSQIFYAYIHDSYFGYRLEGCEMASSFIFSKPALSLSSHEACFIASLLARPLPKSVFEAIELEKKIRVITPEIIIRIGELQGLKWARAVNSRYQYALEILPSTPSSLRTR
ncbi:biosynthetic peptidoglycan transglycosylase [Pseudooctadecabacter jejudonensis]|uniref:Penicillin-binding protein 4 n=1 Tax=Pseudooctadecabacter jejudonensis TaxID=1391910 RepID=A0A1Y5S795_9RHOB|nr:biosynthetic peptidoglycan transglycosylase [Pseudooctadecabacter jejudonensis]SLN31441.1 Penicillin-binding protein 4 precursor [Pseudooctadecabacter jejudonensis]